jgi:hypothetical protein
VVMENQRNDVRHRPGRAPLQKCAHHLPVGL